MKYKTVKNVEIKQKKKIGGPSLKPALKALRKALGQNIMAKPNMENNPNMKYKTFKSLKDVDISNKKNKTGGSTTKSPAKNLLKQISKSKPGMNYKPVTRRGGK